MPKFMIKILKKLDPQVEDYIETLKEFGGSINEVVFSSFLFAGVAYFFFIAIAFLIGMVSGRSIIEYADFSIEKARLIMIKGYTIWVIISLFLFFKIWSFYFFHPENPDNIKYKIEEAYKKNLPIAMKKRFPEYQKEAQERRNNIPKKLDEYSEVLSNDVRELLRSQEFLLDNIKNNKEKALLNAAFNATRLKPLRPVEHSAMINGGIANAIAGPAAGVVVAMQTEADNIIAQANYEKSIREYYENTAANNNVIRQSSKKATSSFIKITDGEKLLVQILKEVPEYKYFLDKIYRAYGNTVNNNFNIDKIVEICQEDDTPISDFILDRMIFLSNARGFQNSVEYSRKSSIRYSIMQRKKYVSIIDLKFYVDYYSDSTWMNSVRILIIVLIIITVTPYILLLFEF